MDHYVKANAVFSLFSKNYMDLKKGLPIRPSELGVLNILVETEGPHTPVMLAELLEVSKPMITAHLTALCSKGYIVREQSPEDKRVYYIHPTEKALALVESSKADMSEKLSRLVDAMGQARFEQMLQLVDEANGTLNQERRL